MPEEDRAFATRLARYCARNPVALERLTYDRTAKAVTYRSDKSDGPTAGTETADPLEFLARVLVHIPDKGQVTTRYYGWYATSAYTSATPIEFPIEGYHLTILVPTRTCSDLLRVGSSGRTVVSPCCQRTPSENGSRLCRLMSAPKSKADSGTCRRTLATTPVSAVANSPVPREETTPPAAAEMHAPLTQARRTFTRRGTSMYDVLSESSSFDSSVTGVQVAPRVLICAPSDTRYRSPKSRPTSAPTTTPVRHLRGALNGSPRCARMVDRVIPAWRSTLHAFAALDCCASASEGPSRPPKHMSRPIQSRACCRTEETTATTLLFAKGDDPISMLMECAGPHIMSLCGNFDVRG